jgi:type VI secretion system protein ImpJ
MFLRPQHFQAAERYWSDLIATSSRWGNPYNYGIKHIEISPDALANYHLQVTACEAMMRDGTVLSLRDGREPERRELKEAFARHGEVMAYLAIPKLTMGRANVARQRAGSDQQRFFETTLEVQDESLGGNDQEIQFRDLNVRLLLSTDDLSGYETLPIGRIKRAGQEEATPVLDDGYFPPLLGIDAWEPLSFGLIRSIYDLIGERIEVLTARAQERKMSFSAQQPGDLDDLLLLMALNEAYAGLHCLSFSQSAHPFPTYLELCRIVGRFSVFGDARRVADDIPVYDHDDLARIFTWIRIRLEQLLGSRKKLEFEQRYFVGAGRGMQVSIEPKWLLPGWSWYVGVNGQNVSDRDCRDLLRPGKLDWKMGSSQQIDLIFRHGLPGVEQKELNQTPRALPPHNWVFYEIQRGNAAWKDVLGTQTLALRFKEELIGNIDTLAGQRQLEVVLPDKRAIMEFALFAVPSSEIS